MEQEYKWVMPCDFNIENSWKNDDLGVKLLDTDKILMKAVYYDTEDGLLANMHGALRVRCENGRSICCMKILSSCNGAYKNREEYEVETDSVLEGLMLLPSKNAPADVCKEISQRPIVVLCSIEFTRSVYHLEINHKMGSCIVEFAVDSGVLRRQKQEQFNEIELEFVSGNDEVFHLYATLMESRFLLVPEPLSKIARAMKL